MLTYIRCPMEWFFYSRTSYSKKTDYPRLCGVEVHGHIAGLYRKTKKPRTFYYQTAISAIFAWFHRWKRACEKEKNRIIMADEETAKKYGKIGAVCVAQYFRDNIKLPRPMEIESHYRTKYNGVEVVGVMDQIRPVSMDFVRNKRPELIEKGKLASGYDSVVIVDLKTEYAGKGFSPDSSIDQKIRSQFKLHEGLEPSIYSYLYEAKHGRKPLGMLWYNLRIGKTFFTYRDDDNHESLFNDLDVFLKNINAENFPKNIGKHCAYCDYIEYCQDKGRLVYSEPEEIYDMDLAVNLRRIYLPREIAEPKQLKLKLK